MEIAGKIIEIDVTVDTFTDSAPVVTRFDELPPSIQETLTVIVKGVRNIPGITYQRVNEGFTKYVGNVGQDLVESVYSFTQYNPIPVTQLIQSYSAGNQSGSEGLTNLGWRGWEGIFPSPIIVRCPDNPVMNEKTFAYYDEAVMTSSRRILPLISYFHQDPRPDKFSGTALTGVQPYRGSSIPGLTGKIVFTDFARRGEPQTRGVLAYTDARTECRLNDFYVIQVDYDFNSQSAYYMSLGTNSDQTRLYLGVYGSANVTDSNRGMVFEVIP